MKIRYTVKITGHEAPFQWEVRRYGPGASPITPTDVECRGEADSRDAAIGEAYSAARAAEWYRQHKSVEVEEELFDFETEKAPTPPPASIEDFLPDHMTGDPWPYMD